MSSSKYSLTNVLRRLLLLQPHNTAAPDLPNELIFDEILTHLQDTDPTSLDGLQVAFTCKEFNSRLQPVVARAYIHNLIDAYSNRHLAAYYHPATPDEGVRRMKIATFTRKAEAALRQSYHQPTPPSESFPTFQLSYLIHFGAFDDAGTLWSLCNLVSLPHVAQNLRYFEMCFKPSDEWAVADSKCEERSGPDDEWKRAFTTLLGRVCTLAAPGGIDLLLCRWECLIGDFPEGFLIHQPTSSSLFSGSRLRDLCISGCILNLLSPVHINSLLRHSSSTLTHLTLCRCYTPSVNWQKAFSQCHLPSLEEFTIYDSNITLNILITFLGLNPSILSAAIRIPFRAAFSQGSRLEIRLEDRLRFLPRLRKLTGTTDFLLALFTPLSGTDIDIPLYNLEDLRIVKDSPFSGHSVQYSEVTQLLSRIPAPNKTSKQALIALRSIALELAYSRSATELWLESALPPMHTSGRDAEGVIASLFRAASDFVAPARAREVDLAEVLAALGHISKFELDIHHDDWSGQGLPPRVGLHPYTVVGFISALPGLREVVLEGVFGRPREAVADAEEFWGALGRIWDVCENLQALEINGIGGSNTPAVWNRGEEEPTPGFAAWASAFAA